MKMFYRALFLVSTLCLSAEAQNWNCAWCHYSIPYYKPFVNPSPGSFTTPSYKPETTPVQSPKNTAGYVPDTLPAQAPKTIPGYVTETPLTHPAVAWSIARRKTDTIEFTIRGAPGTAFRLQTSPDLRVWSELVKTSIDASGQNVIALEIKGGTKFFRLAN